MKILIADNNTDLTERQFGEARVVIAGGKVVKDNLGCHAVDDSGSITLQLPPYVEAQLPEDLMSRLVDDIADAFEDRLGDKAYAAPLTEVMARVSNELQARAS